ncbi:Carbonic anhydrase chloroplastic, partial [Bienertia sinuspersici]
GGAPLTLARAQLKNTTRPSFFASTINSSSPVPPSLIRNHPVFAAPSPVITPTLAVIYSKEVGS